MKENDIVDMITSKVHTVEVKIFWFTKSGRWAYVGNPYQGISESFKVNFEKLKPLQV